MVLPEDFLHFIWKFSLFNSGGLKTCSGENLEILNPGFHNLDSGPDFATAKLRIDGTIWAGNVEIHLRSSDWFRHRHHTDPAYDNVILHVVLLHDSEVSRSDNSLIPVLELQERIPDSAKENYCKLMANLNWIPCQDRLMEVDRIYHEACLNRVLMERLMQKTALIIGVLNELKGSWDDAFYRMLSRNFGFKTNSLPFELLSRALPLQLISKYRGKFLQTEALIFGQAGFLSHPSSDKYPNELRKEYQYLRKKHSLHAIDNYLWKYMRLRPQNFPTRRLAQFAGLIVQSAHLFSGILEFKETPLLLRKFRNVPVNEYWNDHYRFAEACDRSNPEMGEESANNILINTVAPFLLAYGKTAGSEKYIQHSLDLLYSLPPENNAVITRFQKIGLKPANAAQSQALIQLKKCYCDEKKCLSCEIGSQMIKS